MEVIILAAGRGSRMGALSDQLPKPMIPISNGRGALEINLASLSEVSPQCTVTVVSGYKNTVITDFIASNYPPAAGTPPSRHRVRERFNAQFATLGPVNSIHVALEEARGTGFAVLNGDTLFDPQFLRQAMTLAETPGITILGSIVDTADADAMNIHFNDDGTIAAIAKGMPLSAPFAISAGFALFNGPVAADAARNAVRSLRDEEIAAGKPSTWHAIFARLSAAGHPARFARVDARTWTEFDTAESIRAFAPSSLS